MFSILVALTLPLVMSMYIWNINYYVLLLPPCIILCILAFRSSSDPYGLIHLSLNQDSKDVPPKTEWLNMGYWKDTDRFPDACEALATKLIEAAEYKAGHRVLDVGHGTGESLVFLLSSDKIPRPSSLTGITSLTVHHQRSAERIRKFTTTDAREAKPTVVLYHGDAVYRHTDLKHPLDPSQGPVFDTILALDCAYHFDTRRTFLTQCLRKLTHGGRVALADICFSPSSLTPWNRIAISLLQLMPKRNIISTSGYVEMMEEIGYVDVTFEDISEDVFPAFTAFLSSRGSGWAVFARVLSLYVRLGARFVIVSGRRGDLSQ